MMIMLDEHVNVFFFFFFTKTPVDAVSRAYNYRNDATHICMHML